MMTPGQLKNFSQSVLATSVFLSNAYFFMKTGYFDQRSEEMPLLHTWSLAVEEQYYILFPFLLMFIWAFWPKLLKQTLVGLFCISLYLSISVQTSNPSFNFFLLPTRSWELLTGALLAVHFRTLRPWVFKSQITCKSLEIIGLACVVLPFFYLSGNSPFPGVNALPVVFGSALLILCMHSKSIIGRLLSTKIFVGIGLVSYSAYLIHQPLFVFTRMATSELSVVISLTLIVLTFILAYFSWRYVEKPFRDKNRISRKIIFSTGITAIFIFAALGAVGHITRGVPQRFDQSTLTVASTAQQSPYRKLCHTDSQNYLKPADACTYHKGPATWAVFGDSHVVEIAAALADYLAVTEQAIKHLSFSGCPPAIEFDVNNPGCNEWTKESIKYLETSKNIGSVIIIYRHSFHLYGDQLSAYPNLPNLAPSFLTDISPNLARQQYWENLKNIVEKLTASGKKVYLLDPIPELPSHIDRFIFERKHEDNHENIYGTPLDFYKKRTKETLQNLSVLAQMPNVSRLIVQNAICEQEQCQAIIGGKALYFDDNHLSLYGAQIVVSHLQKQGQLPLSDFKAYK